MVVATSFDTLPILQFLPIQPRRRSSPASSWGLCPNIVPSTESTALDNASVCLVSFPVIKQNQQRALINLSSHIYRKHEYQNYIYIRTRTLYISGVRFSKSNVYAMSQQYISHKHIPKL